SPAAVSARVIPPVWPLEPAPTRLASKRATLFEGSNRRSQAAAERPENPPPTTAKSTSVGRGLFLEENSIVQGVAPQFVLGAGPDMRNLRPRNWPGLFRPRSPAERFPHQAEC